MNYIIFFILAFKYSSAFEKNCTAYNSLNNKVNSCQRNNLSCSLLVYTNEFNKYLLSLKKNEKELNDTNFFSNLHPQTIDTKTNITYVFLNQCHTSCKSSISDLLLLNCYKNCFIVAYNCPSFTLPPSKKSISLVTNNTTLYKTTTYEVVLVSIIIVWFSFLVIKFTCCQRNYEFRNRVHITTFTNV